MGSVRALGTERWTALAWRWPLCVLLWLTPSIAQLSKWAGWPRALAVVGVAAVGIGLLLAWAAAPPTADRGKAPPWNLLVGVALCLLFAVAYPIATSQLIGRGSDRADAVDVVVRALLAGRRLYDPLTYLGNPPTPMPGAVFLGVPFHLMGSAALQNVFWFLLFSALAPRLVGGRRAAAAYLMIFILFCPGVVVDFATGGDFATNVIYVIVAVWLMTRLGPQETWPVRLLACLFFACALSSRGIYIVEAPIVAGALLQRLGPRRAFETMACVGGLLVVINAPAWADDPSRFPLLMHAGMMGVYPHWLHPRFAIPVLSIAIASSALFIRMDEGRMWLWSALSLAPLLVPSFIVFALHGDPLVKLVVPDSYTLPVALFAGLWLLGLPPGDPANGVAAAAPAAS